MDCSPSGTRFDIKAGIYRLQSVTPKNNDTFVGEPGAVLSGAVLLTSFTKQGNYWVVAGQTQQGQVNGTCAPGFPECGHPEDLYFDDVPLLAVASLDAVVPSTWYFDYSAHIIYFADDPTGHRVETSVTRYAFGAGAPLNNVGVVSGVTIQNLTVEKFAIPAQMGAIGSQYPGSGWLVENWEVRWNHGAGIRLGPGGQALNNYIHGNGQEGIGGFAPNIVLKDNEISLNNYAGFARGWECGGAKFLSVSDLVVTGNNVHDNNGPGLWTDGGSINVVYDSNVVTNNAGSGIVHEISYGARITNNVVKDNSPGYSVWLWGSQILVQNSQNVEVSGNTVEVASVGGNGIGLIEQSRGSGTYGPYVTQNNSVHNNDITHLSGGIGKNGAVRDDGSNAIFSSNTFDFNTYHVPNVTKSYWYWNSATLAWASLNSSTGLEAHGALNAISAAAPAITSNGLTSLSAFGGFALVAPGSWIQIYGAQLSTATSSWALADFSGNSAPASLDGVTVSVNGQAAFVEYVSPTQINALLPSALPEGPAEITVGTGLGTSQPYSVTVHPYQPGLLAPPTFTISGKQYVAAQFADGVYVLPPEAIPGVTSRRASPGDTISIYGIGFGPSATASGQVMPAGQLVSQATSLTAPLQLFFGQTTAQVTYAGLVPNTTGLYQINVVVPNVSGSDATPFSFTLNGTSGPQALYTAVQ